MMIPEPGPICVRGGVEIADGLTGQLLGEYFEPGDFYSSHADPAWYARWQLTASF